MRIISLHSTNRSIGGEAALGQPNLRESHSGGLEVSQPGDSRLQSLDAALAYCQSHTISTFRNRWSSECPGH